MRERMRGRIDRFVRRSTEGSLRADVVGTLYILGAILGVLSLSLPHPDQGELPIAAAVVVATITGALLIAKAPNVGTRTIHTMVAFGSVLINVMILAAGVAAGVYTGMFCWVVLVSVNFFRLRAAIAQFAFMMGCFAVVLALVESGGDYSAVTRWITLGMALAVTGGATLWLVSRRRLAEQATQRFIDLSQEMLCTIDAAGRLRKLNPAWERTLGFPLSELEGMDAWELVHPGDRRDLRVALSQLRDGTDALVLENRCHDRDGRIRSLLWTASYSQAEALVYAQVRPRRAEPAGDDEGSRIVLEAPRRSVASPP